MPQFPDSDFTPQWFERKSIRSLTLNDRTSYRSVWPFGVTADFPAATSFSSPCVKRIQRRRTRRFLSLDLCANNLQSVLI
ncbi:uncharacterized protein ARMOST_21387 [Armillaria ostoyae]|uniref:Uncharacterized protein n=1 Tax=Armillaria ostoyae TaxID=47428 RepID=A0A284S9Z0_ARMOS|nr:uncharacterized protein ARMOST_21387 [Armillaria ostoyae]